VHQSWAGTCPVGDACAALARRFAVPGDRQASCGASSPRANLLDRVGALRAKRAGEDGRPESVRLTVSGGSRTPTRVGIVRAPSCTLRDPRADSASSSGAGIFGSAVDFTSSAIASRWQPGLLAPQAAGAAPACYTQTLAVALFVNSDTTTPVPRPAISIERVLVGVCGVGCSTQSWPRRHRG